MLIGIYNIMNTILHLLILFKISWLNLCLVLLFNICYKMELLLSSAFIGSSI